MISDERYAIEAIHQMNELKFSLSEDEKKSFANQVENIDFYKDFFEPNIIEIEKFIKVTPKQRLSTKKWQKDYAFYVYGAYVALLLTVNQQLIPRMNFFPIASYRKDLASLVVAGLDSPRIVHGFYAEEPHTPSELYTRRPL